MILSKIIEKQKQIFLVKNPGKRLEICLEMTDFARLLAENRIKAAIPDITAPALKAEVFKLFYHNDFPSEKLEENALWLQDNKLSC